MESRISTLASELVARIPPLSAEEQRVGLEIYRQLARGAPVVSSQLAQALDTPTNAIDDVLAHANLKPLTYRDPQGRIIGFGGLAVREMPHRFMVDGHVLYTWCAWDSLFIPVILDLAAEVDSPAPGSIARVHLRVASDGVKRVQPSSAVMSFLLPSAETFQADAVKAIASFCHYIFFFPNLASARTWTRSLPETTVISVSDAFELGRQMVAARWWTRR